MYNNGKPSESMRFGIQAKSEKLTSESMTQIFSNESAVDPNFLIP